MIDIYLDILSAITLTFLAIGMIGVIIFLLKALYDNWGSE